MNRILLFVCITSCVIAGCKPSSPAPASHRTTGAATGRSDREHLDAAMDYLQRADEFEESQASFQVAYHLNRWLETQSADAAWEADALVAKMPRDIRNSRDIADLGRLRFAVEDSKALQEAVWLKQISKWVSPRVSDSVLEDWIKQALGAKDAVGAEQLLVASRLFDWTIRNIRLDELPAYPADVAAQPTPEPGKVTPTVVPAPQRGVPGPGYQFHPWQVLLYGRGDAWQRARVFILLCRQEGVDAVMLAFPGKTTTPRPRPWLAAVLIGKQLYLFDTQLGLPIFGPKGLGIATLEQVLADHSLLDALNLDEQRRYPLEISDLGEILALQDASAAALSRRMNLLERQLSGQNRVVLTTSPNSIRERLMACRGIADSRIWSVPFEAAWYQRAIMQRIGQNPQAAAEFYRQFGVFTMRNTLVRGRYLHFRGLLDSQGETVGAKKLYLDTRLPREQLNVFATSEDVQRSLGFEREQGERESFWKGRLQSAQIMMTQAKLHATYWLGLAQYDTDKLDAAIEWFDRRTLQAGDDSPWMSAARYNLGRTYEQLRDIEQACRCYETVDSSPQEYGNRLRARWLRQTRGKPASN